MAIFEQEERIESIAQAVDLEGNQLAPFSDAIATIDHAHESSPHVDLSEPAEICRLRQVAEASMGLTGEGFEIALSGVRAAINAAGGPFKYIMRDRAVPEEL